jgi:hypothetical protein
MPGALTISPQTTLSGFSGAPDTLYAMVAAAQSPRGEQSAVVRSVAERIVGKMQPKDYLGEILAVRNFVAEHCRFTNDPLHVERVKDPQRIVEEIATQGWAACDCDESALLIATLCLQLGRVAEFVVAGFGERGHYSHVFTRVLEPKSNQWVVCDPVAGTQEREMLGRITTYVVYSLDEPAGTPGKRMR